jgi:hypothetical protein
MTSEVGSWRKSPPRLTLISAHSGVLREGEGAAARKSQAGDQGAGDGGAAAQYPAWIVAREGRQESGERRAVGQHGEKPADMRECVGDPLERRRLRAIGRCLHLRHLEHDRAGAEHLGEVAAAVGLARFCPPAREDITPKLRPARQQPAAQRFGLRFGRAGRGGIGRQQ